MHEADFENGLTVDEVPILKARQTVKKAKLQEKPIDTDVWQLISEHKDNKEDMIRMNSVLRSLLA